MILTFTNASSQSISSESESLNPQLYSVQFKIILDGKVYATPSALIPAGERVMIENTKGSRYRLEFDLKTPPGKKSHDISEESPHHVSQTLVSADIFLPQTIADENTDLERVSTIALEAELQRVATARDQIYEKFIPQTDATQSSKYYENLEIEVFVVKSQVSLSEIVERANSCKQAQSQKSTTDQQMLLDGRGLVNSRRCCSSGSLRCCWNRNCCAEGGRGCCV